MGHVITLGVELRCPIDGVLQDAEKLRRDLFPACHGRFDSGSRELSLESFELLQNFGGFHCGRSKNTVFAGPRQSFLRNRGSDLHCPTPWTPRYTKIIIRQCLESTLGRSSRGFVPGHSDGGVRISRQRLKEAVTEIKKVARVDPVTAGDGVVSLMERIWPAFQDVDTSSGALGGAVYWAQDELLPIAIEAPVDRKTRDKWLDRLWQAIEDDGVNYLSPVGNRWGELCGSREVASYWADRFLGLLRTAWSDPRPGNHVRGTSICLSSLLAAEPPSGTA